MCSWENLFSFSVPWETEKVTEPRFARGISYTGWHYGMYIYIYTYIYIYIYISVFLLVRMEGERGGGRPVKTLFVSVELLLYLFCFNFMLLVYTGHTNFGFK